MNKIIYGDMLVRHEEIQSGSVDLVLTDLPYGNIKGMDMDAWTIEKTDWDNAIDPAKVFAIADRILRKNGKLVLFSQEPYTTRLISEAISNVPFCYRMIWEKDHFANALLAKKAPVGFFEDILVFYKCYDSDLIHPLRPYFKQIFEFIAENKKSIIEKVGQNADHCFRFDSSQFSLCTEACYNKIIEAFGIDKMGGVLVFCNYAELRSIDAEFKTKFTSTFNLWEGNKYKSNILKYKKDYHGLHPTQKPVLLLEDLIKTFSNEGDLVVDLTAGSGSTAEACVNTNRFFIIIEMKRKFFITIIDRISKKINLLLDNFDLDLNF